MFKKEQYVFKMCTLLPEKNFFPNTATLLKLFSCRFFNCAVTPKIIVDFELDIILPSHGHFVIIKRPKTNKKNTSSGFNHLHHNIHTTSGL